MGKATQDLRNEHDAILNVLNILDKALADDTKDEAAIVKFGGELVHFLKIFADTCHHGKEENFLFVELTRSGVPNQGGPVGVMLQEHRLGREYIAAMSGALESKNLGAFKAAAGQYRDLLVSHIAKENNALFVMADRLLDEAKQAELYEKFENHEETVVGHGVHEELHAMIHRWEDEFGV